MGHPAGREQGPYRKEKELTSETTIEQPDDALLEVTGLSLGLHRGEEIRTLVSSFSLGIGKGDCTGIVGESGSGKTLSALSVMGLLPENISIDAGRIWFSSGGSGTDLTRCSEETMRRIRGGRIGMIFQEVGSAMNPVIRCGRQVEEAILAHRNMTRREVRERVLDLFDEVRLPDPRSTFAKYPHQLSGGQLQRIMIAMAISCDPDLLIADEPTTALDVTTQKSIIALLQQVRSDRGMGILFISHDLGVIKMIADNVAVMYRGKVVEDGPVEDIYERPGHPYTKGLIACRPAGNAHSGRLPTVEEYLSGASLGDVTPGDGKRGDLKQQDKKGKDILLRAENISIRFPAGRKLLGGVPRYHEAVHNVSFELMENETLGIIGESGSGKTSIGRSIVRLIELPSGRISYRGQAIDTLQSGALRKFRRKVQIIFQDPYSSLDPLQKTGDALTEVLKVHSLCKTRQDRRARAKELLDQVRLPGDSYSRYPHEFSGGQRQRAVIARALAAGPEFIICDESVSGLDVSVQAVILNLLNELKRELGLSYIFISHDLSVIRYMSDRVLVLREGRIMEQGASDRVFGSPGSSYTRELLEAVPE